MIDLGTLGGTSSAATAVNNNGQVVGTADTTNGGLLHGQWDAFSWTQAGGMIDLGTLGGGGTEISDATAVNDNGQVVGDSTNGTMSQEDWNSYAFSWTQAGGMVDLGTLPGWEESSPNAVNNNGQVAGFTFSPQSSLTDAFSWTQTGGMVNLGTLPGQTSALAVAVNNNGQVVGNSGLRVSWTQAGGMIDIGTLPGGSFSEAAAVNDNGQVVGVADNASSEDPFLWTQSGGMIDLGNLASPQSQAPPVGGSPSVQSLRGGGGFCLPCLMKAIIRDVVGHPVDTEDGNMYTTQKDLTIPGRGIPLAFTRSYNSNAAGTNGPLGYGWVDNLRRESRRAGDSDLRQHRNLHRGERGANRLHL